MDSIIIIGAGAAGLMAARRLAAAGHVVTVLEAAREAGGRIHTLGGESGFSMPVEGGAEFIHGDLPLSLQLAKEAGISLQPVAAQMVQMRGGKQPDKKQQNGMSKDWDQLMRRMAMAGEDRPLAEFLTEWFSGDRYRELRYAAGRMAEGYDLADLHRVSTHSLYREWAGPSEETEYRPQGGYGPMVGYLTEICRRHGCRFHFSTTVTAVRWQRGRVAVDTTDGGVFDANRLVCTVSLGVLKTGGLQFIPELPRQRAAIVRLGFGSVIKVLLEFKKPFWEDRKKTGRTLFIISDEPAPTWWTQNADDCPLITGWIAGGPIRDFRESDGATRIETCLQSLARLFSREPERLRKELKTSAIQDWETAPFIRGGYSFETVDGAADRAVLASPVENTLYFAGEAVYEGSVPGTVEAAFSTGNMVAEKIGC